MGNLYADGGADAKTNCDGDGNGDAEGDFEADGDVVEGAAADAFGDTSVSSSTNGTDRWSWWPKMGSDLLGSSPASKYMRTSAPTSKMQLAQEYYAKAIHPRRRYRCFDIST